MKKLTALTITFLFTTSYMCASESALLERVLEESDQEKLQQTANLLMLFVTENPSDADKILHRESGLSAQAKSAALDAIQKTCCISLNQLKSEPMYRIKKYEELLNKLYNRVCLRLNKAFSRILYGPRKGEALPERIRFFINKERLVKSGRIRLSETQSPSLLEKIIGIFG